MLTKPTSPPKAFCFHLSECCFCSFASVLLVQLHTHAHTHIKCGRKKTWETEADAEKVCVCACVCEREEKTEWNLEARVGTAWERNSYWCCSDRWCAACGSSTWKRKRIVMCVCVCTCVRFLTWEREGNDVWARYNNKKGKTVKKKKRLCWMNLMSVYYATSPQKVWPFW